MGFRVDSTRGGLSRFSALVFVGCVAMQSMLAHGDSPAELQRKIVAELAAGRDAGALIEQFRATHPAGVPASPTPNRSQESAELQLRLNEFERALAVAARRTKLDRQALYSLLAPYQALQAAHLLFEQRFVTVQEELARANVGVEFERRRQRAQQSYVQVMADLTKALDPALGALQRAQDQEKLLADSGFRDRALTAIRAARTLLGKHVSRRAAPILRANSLPFRQAKLAQRAPKLTPAIQPSYLNPSDATVPAQPEDTAATADAPLTDEILRKAEDLGYDYIRIYEFVRNEIRTEWYAGAMKGATGTLRQKSGNDVDQANLLIALFRASGLPSRYVHGVIELPIEDVMSSLDLRDPAQATAALTRAGVAYNPVVRGGRIAAVNVEHTWVSAFVPYTNYRGAVVDVSGKTWLPLMPALKRYEVTPATRIFATAGLTAGALLDSYLGEEQTLDPLALIRKQVTDYLHASGAPDTYEQQLGASSVAAKNLGLLPNTLPVGVVAVTGETAQLADAYRQRVRFVVRRGVRDADPVVLDYTVPVSDIASERVTLSYIPATVDDQKTANLFGGLDNTPAYLIKLRPQIKINGRAKSVAQDALDTGTLNRFELHLLGPTGAERLDQVVTAGGYHAVGVYAQEVARHIAEDDPADTEFLAAKLLDRIAYTYADRWNQAERELAGLLDVAYVRPRPTVAIAGNALRVDMVFGRAMQLEWQGVNLDAALRISEPVARDGSAATAKAWMQLSALQGSALEHLVFEEEFLVDSISADKGLQLARAAGVEVLRITSANVGSVLPPLAHAPEVKADIENWTRLGMVVDLPRGPITRNAWTGSVWRVEDAASGAAGYFIAGGLAGGETTVTGDGWLLTWLRDALRAANSPGPNVDPLSTATITKIYSTDGQKGEAGDALPTLLAVLVRDKVGRPVYGAPITFEIVGGDGKVNGGPAVTVLSDFLGLATVNHELGQRTDSYPIYVLRNPGDEFVTRAGANLVDAWVPSHTGTKVITEPFTSIAHPRAPVRLVNSNGAGGSAKPGMWSDTIVVMVEDEFGNAVSNVDVTFAATGAVGACDPPSASPSPASVFDDGEIGRGCPNFPVLGTCDSASRSEKSSIGGASSGVIGSRGFRNFTVTATASNVPGLNFGYQGVDACSATTEVFGQSSFLMNEEGFNINAAKVGERFKRPVEVSLSVGTARDGYTPAGAEDPRFTIDNGGGVMPASAVGPGIYQTTVFAGPAAARHTISFLGKNVGGIRNDDGSDRMFSMDVPSVFGLKPEVTEVFMPGQEPGYLYLTADGQTAGPAEVRYNTPPGEYRSLTTDVDFLEDGTWWDYVIGSTRSGAGVAKVPRGATFDPDKEYEAQVVVNRGSVVEVKSDKFPLEIAQKLFKDVTESVGVFFNPDIVNQRVCQKSDTLEFTLTQPATVTLVFRGRDDAGNPTGQDYTIINAQSFAKGKHTREITVSDLPPQPPGWSYLFELKGISERDGHQETEKGTGTSGSNQRNRLPVGHTLVKGVDVWDGTLSLGASDFSVPGRGAALEFRRSWSSNGGMHPGRLGMGWTHNYESKVIITSCGEAIVVGGEGGGMTFVEDGQGGLRPLKGYHGTLVPNHTDRTFDFYSKDGTRYHYRNFGTFADGDPEWMLEFIEDTNGNVTRLGYDPTSQKLAKLITVEDSSGRQLTFKYEDRTFTQLPVHTVVTPVVTEVEGPDGIKLTFAYDDYGNLVRTAREANARVETYGYATGDNAPWWARHKLTSHTDPNGNLTQYSYNEENFWTIWGQQVLPSLHLPYSVVESITEPEGGATRFHYDFARRVTRVTDARGNDTSYTTNQYGAVVSITDPVGTTAMTWAADDIVMTSKTDARGSRTDYTYDANANLLTETVDGKTTRFTYETFPARPIKNRVKTRTDRNGHTTAYRYDPRGNLLSEIDPEGGETRHTYAANGDRVETRDPNGNVTRFTYDAYGNLETATNALGGVTRTRWNVRSLPVEVTDPLARKTTFQYDTLNRVTTKTDPLGSHRRFTYDNVGNKLTETDEEGRITTWTYDKENRVKTIRDPLSQAKSIGYDAVGNKVSESDWQGNVTAYEYDAANRLIQRTEPLGKITSFTYDPVGNVLTETDPLNRVTRHEYDALNRRIKTTDALSGVMAYGYDGVGNKTSHTDPLGRTTTFAYDGLDRLVTTTEPLGKVTKYKYDANGNRTEETDARNHTRKVVFDALNRPVKRIDALNHFTNFEYDAASNLTLEINARLFKTAHEYDALNRRTRTTVDTGSDVSAVASRGQSVTSFAYDKVGNRIEEVLPNGNRLTNVYDALNRLTAISDQLGSVATYGYDANGNRTGETDANGNVTTKRYDALNRLTQVDLPEGRTIKYAYDLVGNKTKETDPRNNATDFAYDALNRLSAVSDPLNQRTEYTYDALGNKLTETDKRGHVTRFEYDDLNRLSRTTDALSQAVTFGYDLLGNKTEETDKRGTKTEYAYDKENRLTRTMKAGVTLAEFQYDELGQKKFETDANGNVTTWIYDDGRGLVLLESRPLAALTRHFYDAIGNRIETRDPEHRITRYTYDARRRLTTDTNSEAETTTYTYDGNGNRTSLRRPLGNTWAYAFDAANRLTRLTDPLNGATGYTYDRNSNRLTQTDANGNTTRYEYDALNRQTAMVYADAARAEFRYDENGNRIGLTDPKGQVFSYVFDALNRETDKNYPLPATPTGDDIQSIVTQYDENGNPTRITETYTGATGTRVTAKTYDPFDRLTEVTDAFGKRIRYSYDANGNRTALTDPDNKVTRYTFDALNRVANVINAGGTTTYEYDRSSLQTQVSYPNGTTATNTYDRARRMLSVTNRQGVALVSSYAYGYDANGNRTSQVETNGGAAETTAYQFDGNDRLTEVRYPDKTTTYTYDANYNRLTERTVNNATSATEADKAYSYNNRNQLSAISDQLNSQDSVSYGFDANGNQIAKTKNGTTTAFVYDVRDQLTAVRENATAVGLFQYDYQGMRVAKDMGGQIVRYTYDQKSVLLQTDNTGTTIAKYDYGSDKLLSLNHATEGRQFYLFDALGSVANLTTPAGSVQARYQYDAFGNFRSQAGASFNRFTFTGHEKDTETNLFYFKARFYDPDTGRFLNQDPYLGEIDTPPSLHRYLYAYANPLVYIDLTGYASTCYGDCPPERTPDEERAYQAQREADRAEKLRPRTPQEHAEAHQRLREKEAKRRKAEQSAPLSESENSAGTERVARPDCGGDIGCEIRQDKLENVERNKAQMEQRGREAGEKAKEHVEENWFDYLPLGIGKVIPQPVKRKAKDLLKKGKKAEEKAEDAADAGKAVKRSDVPEPTDPYDVEAWKKYYDANPGVRRSVGAAGAKGALEGIPSKVTDTLDHIKRTGKAPPGYRGGRTFKNDGRGDGQKLPEKDASGNPITYREYDVTPYQKGVNRGAERLVRGSDGKSYYTNDHYKTFIPIE